MSRNYKFHYPKAAYFVSFSTVYWIDVFTRQRYFDIMVSSVNYCRKEKGMILFAYCFMPSHVHLIFSSTKNEPGALLRDFKRFTSVKVVEAIRKNPKESRKEWLIAHFKKAAKSKSNVQLYQFWQHHNQPMALWSASVIRQKRDYVHRNPVEAGFVNKPADWKYSSARNYLGDQSVMEIDLIRGL